MVELHKDNPTPKTFSDIDMLELGKQLAEAELFRIVGKDPMVVRSPSTGKVLGVLARYDEEKIGKQGKKE